MISFYCLEFSSSSPLAPGASRCQNGTDRHGWNELDGLIHGEGAGLLAISITLYIQRHHQSQSWEVHLASRQPTFGTMRTPQSSVPLCPSWRVLQGFLGRGGSILPPLLGSGCSLNLSAAPACRSDMQRMKDLKEVPQRDGKEKPHPSSEWWW